MASLSLLACGTVPVYNNWVISRNENLVLIAHAQLSRGIRGLKGYAHLEANLAPFGAKTENCFSQISFDWFIRRMTEV